MSSVTISKNKIKIEGDKVVMTLKEYHKLLEKSATVYYLKGKQALRLDKLVEDGLKEYHEGKTITAPSLKEALKIHARKRGKR
ncbi:MAG: hypothetical protein Q8Q95_02100 [bacterium]|nr:hypothetical protein [bacterium]